MNGSRSQQQKQHLCKNATGTHDTVSIMSPDDNCLVRRAKRQTVIETWWRRGGLSDDQYRVLDALASDFESRLRSRSGRFARVGNGGDLWLILPRGSAAAGQTWTDAECDRLARLAVASRAIGALKDRRAWPLLEIVLCDLSPARVTSVAQAANRARIPARRAFALLRDCADALLGSRDWRRAAQRVPIWAIG